MQPNTENTVSQAMGRLFWQRYVFLTKATKCYKNIMVTF